MLMVEKNITAKMDADIRSRELYRIWWHFRHQFSILFFANIGDPEVNFWR